MQNLNFQMQFSKGGANAGEAWAMDVSDYIVRNQKPAKFNTRL